MSPSFLFCPPAPCLCMEEKSLMLLKTKKIYHQLLILTRSFLSILPTCFSISGWKMPRGIKWLPRLDHLLYLCFYCQFFPLLLYLLVEKGISGPLIGGGALHQSPLQVVFSSPHAARETPFRYGGMMSLSGWLRLPSWSQKTLGLGDLLCWEGRCIATMCFFWSWSFKPVCLFLATF